MNDAVDTSLSLSFRPESVAFTKEIKKNNTLKNNE